MRSRIRSIKQIICVVGLLPSLTLLAQPAKPNRPSVPAAASFDSVEISLNGATQKARIHIIDLGDVASGQNQILRVEGRNTTTRRLTLDMFPRGEGLDATWSPAERPVFSRKMIDPQASASIDLRFNPPDPALQGLQMVTMFENAAPVTSIIIGYLAHPATITLPIVTPPYQSGLGKQKSFWCTVHSGPTPKGYTYASNAFETAGSSPGGTSLNCVNWVECQPIQANDNDVSWQFRIQGYEHDWTHQNSSVQAVGALTVIYNLKPPPAPVLKAIEKEPGQ